MLSLKILQKSYLKFNKVECIAAPDLCHQLDCSIHPINRHQAVVNMNCKLKAPITEMMLTMILETKNSKNIYTVWANQTVDYCEKIGQGSHVSFWLIFVD